MLASVKNIYFNQKLSGNTHLEDLLYMFDWSCLIIEIALTCRNRQLQGYHFKENSMAFSGSTERFKLYRALYKLLQ